MQGICLDEMTAELPSAEAVGATFEDLTRRFTDAPDSAGRVAVLRACDRWVRGVETAHTLAMVRFRQRTQDDARRAHQATCADRMRDVSRYYTRLKGLALDAADRPALEAQLGGQLFALWAADRAWDVDAIRDELQAEQELVSSYFALVGSAWLSFRGEDVSVNALKKYGAHPDRGLRRAAWAARWGWFADHRGEIDRIFDALVQTRTAMARRLGFSDYVPLAYLRRRRIGYGVAEAATFRAGVQTWVAPLRRSLRAQQAAALGVDALMVWDEGVHSLAGSPAPTGGIPDILDQVEAALAGLSPELGDFVRMMRARGLLDLAPRVGKISGGFATSFPSYGVPFILANLHGTASDVMALIHELGHGFQCWKARDQPLEDYVWPTVEAAEVASMSLEFLCWPHLERLFGADADVVRRQHLTDRVELLASSAAVDAFQHRVYAAPGASPDQRFAFWREAAARFQPGRGWGDLPHGTDGGDWQAIPHLFHAPFYYIDYGLALTGALQLWGRARRRPAEAWSTYTQLCAQGGSACFADLLAAAGLGSPFAAGTLQDIVADVRQAIPES